MHAGDVVGNGQCDRTAVTVGADRIIEQRHAGCESALLKAGLRDGRNADRGGWLVRDRNLAKVRARAGLVFRMLTGIIGRDNRHVDRLEGGRLLTVEITCAVCCQDDVSTLQGKIRRVRLGNIVRQTQRNDAAVGVAAHRVIKQGLPGTETAFRQPALRDRADRQAHRRVDVDDDASRTQRRGHGRMALGRFARVVGCRQTDRQRLDG